MPDAVQIQCEDALVAIIKNMGLEWPRSEEIVARRLGWSHEGDGTVIMHRGITVYPLAWTEAPGTNEREDIGYGIGVLFVMPADHHGTAGRGRVPAAIEAVRRKIYHDRLSITLSGGTYCQTKLLNGGDPNIPREGHNYEVSSLRVRCWVREPRT